MLQSVANNATIFYILRKEVVNMSNLFADISSHNKATNTQSYMNALRDMGCKAVIIKLTEGCQHGTNYRNPEAPEQLRCAKAAGLKVHFYHFFHGRDDQDARCEARFFMQYASDLGVDKNSVMVCDFEDPIKDARRLNTMNVNSFIDELKKAGYQNTDTYSYTYLFNSALYVNELTTKNIWQADYNRLRGDIDYNPGAWQYTSTAVVNGIRTDLNVDYSGFYTGGSQTPAQPYKPAETSQKFTDDLGVTWYKETGTYTLQYATVLRWGATTKSDVIGTLPAGSKVKYDAFCHSGGFVWIRQPREKGFGYLPTGKSLNEKRVDIWGSFS